MKCFRIVVLFLIAVQCVTAAQPESEFSKRNRWIKEHGVVPDQVTAVKIAEAVSLPVFGEEHVRRESPFTAQLRNGIWTVSGTLPSRMKGGIIIVEIRRKDGRILTISHSL